MVAQRRARGNEVDASVRALDVAVDIPETVEQCKRLSAGAVRSIERKRSAGDCDLARPKQVLHIAGDPNGPAIVAKVMADFADDLQIAVPNEGHPPFSIKAIRSFEQTDIPDLPQVLRALAATREPIRDSPHESEVLNHKVVTFRVVVLML